MFGKKEEDKYLDLTPELKKMYGKNWKLICAIERNTKALEDITEQLKRINEKLNR
ncbi:hypothetical protein [Caloramator proteoclasticus]|uniref:Uncharacterized protein n=1 Tax=Caloramator proteoclasticus DSM 10124 TaxID=1121262 RepID=A0A1M4ZF31_9CLOT|nr:hypothetical protein [Caloramator proteoclasticus]SHF16653.1 hypothetical protein SAMN02746091_01906 [Caloramator proteoclasticus DSM 10124]